MKIKYLRAAGLEERRGRPSIGKQPVKSELKKLYIIESKSIREIADILGCSKDMVYRSLKENGIELRHGYNRSKLRKYSLSVLETGIREKGIRGFAKELGIHENTLRYYIRGKKRK